METSGIGQNSIYERNKTLARHCLNCGGVFWVVPSSLKRGGGKYCSRQCSAKMVCSGNKAIEHKKKIGETLSDSGKWKGDKNPKWNGGQQIRQCIRCEKEFTVLSRGKKTRHCSKLCAAEDRGEYFRGENHPGWKGGIGSKKHEKKRMHTKAKEWREGVFKKDGYACAICEKSKPRIHAHHIFSWAKFPELRYDVDNGMTLCLKHHQMFHPNIVLADTRKYFLK